MLFTFPSRNYSTIGRKRYLALPSGLGWFPQDFTCPVVLKMLERRFNLLKYETFTLYGLPFQIYSSKVEFCNFSIRLQSDQLTLTTLILHDLQTTDSPPHSSLRDSWIGSSLHSISLGYSLFARHYSENHLLVSFLAGTERFHFPAFPPIQLWIYCMVSRFEPRWVTPCRKSPDQSLLTAPRGLSQPIASFFGLLRQGIHRMPLFGFIEITILFSFKCATLSFTVTAIY